MTARSFVRLLAFCCLGLAGLQGFAQTATLQSRAGVRHDGPGRVLDSNATFSLGMTRDSGVTYTSTANVTDTVQIRGEIRPEASQIGQSADVFVVDRNLTSGEFRMRTSDGVWVPWNATVSTLVPFRERVTLTSAVSVDMFSGMLGSAAEHRIFLGYLPPDGVLRYHTSGMPITIAASANERAYGLFTSTISPNIIAARCSLCHVNGGLAQAGGAYHIFKLPLTSNLGANYDIFKGLVALRGSSYVLTKVTGGNAHGGGVQLTAGTAEYAALAEFVNLLATDLPPPTGTPSPGTQEPYNPYDPYGN
jgi:hypothetical protein